MLVASLGNSRHGLILSSSKVPEPPGRESPSGLFLSVTGNDNCTVRILFHCDR